MARRKKARAPRGHEGSARARTAGVPARGPRTDVEELTHLLEARHAQRPRGPLLRFRFVWPEHLVERHEAWAEKRGPALEGRRDSRRSERRLVDVRGGHAVVRVR